MDSLAYSYDAGNKLLRVADAANDTYGFTDDAVAVADAADDYSYDANGNLTTDTNKNITGITYNHLNLPTQLTIGGQNILYFYSADGVKQRKTANGVTTDYAGNVIYENSSLKFINHAEGYLEPNGATFRYVFQYKDHLGNIRLSYSDLNGNGLVNASEIIEENNYYPFGMKQRGYNGVVNGTEYKFKFNGKELQDELGLNWYDFGARGYMPDIGRFTTIDPLAEQMRRYSPYNYAFDNPLRFIDPDGMQATDWYRNADGAVVFDENINSQQDLDDTGIDGEYIADSFTAKDQNGDIFVFNEDGTVTDSDATVSMMEGAGIDTSSMIEVTSTLVDDGKNGVTEASLAAGAFLIADDATVIGAVDDILLPAVALTALVGTLVETAPTFSFAKDSSKNERHGDAGALGKAERQIAELEAQLANATGNAAKKIKQKIQNVKRNAAKNKKGETHSRNAKGN